MPISVSLLSTLPFFEGLDESSQEELSKIATLRSFKPMTTIGQAGEVHEAVAYVTAGQLQTKELADDGRVVSLTVLGAGAWIGWLSIVDERYVSQEVTCLTHCQVITFPTRLLKTIVQHNNTLLNRLLALAVQSIELNRRQRMMLTLPNAFQRVCFQISQLSSEVNSETLERISALPRQHELASAANTSRETVSRTLQMLVRAGVIDKIGHRVVVRRLDLLKRLAYDGPEALEAAANNMPGPAPTGRIRH